MMATKKLAPSPFDPKPPQTVPAQPQPVPNRFTPVFQAGITTTAPAMPPQPVTPYACLSEESTQALVKLLADSDLYVFHSHPWGPLFNGSVLGAQDPGGVPWFGWSDGSMLNAGSLATFWTHGQPEAFCLAMAKGTIVLNHQQWFALQNQFVDQQSA